MRIRSLQRLATSPAATILALTAAIGLGTGSCRTAARGEPIPIENRTSSALRGAPIDLSGPPELNEIAQLSDGRTTGRGRLLELALHADPRIQERAVQALGRLPYPEFGLEVTELLCRKLEDETVREAAAFALGLRADPASSGVLASYLHDQDARFRAHVVEAASRIPDPRLHRDLLVALRDADLSVRIEAALATARFSKTDPPADEVERALLDALRPFAISSKRTLRTAVEAELVWRILYALSRRGSELGRGAFLEYASSDVPLERLFAVMGLAQLSADPETVQAAARAIQGATASEDWRVVYEATVALGRFADPSGLEALLAAAEHSNAHVRAGAFEALGAFPSLASRTLPVLRRGLVDLSTEVRNASLRALVRILPAAQALETVKGFVSNSDPVLRYGAAQAAALVPDAQALQSLRTLSRDPYPLVATRAVEALGLRTEGEVRGLLHELLGHHDNGIRLAAVLALREKPDPSDEAPLLTAYETSTGDISAEIAFEVLRSLGRIKGASAEAFVRKALSDDRSYVRKVARSVLEKDFGSAAELSDASRGSPNTEVPLSMRDYPAWTWNPMIEIQTTRGAMVFELFPAEAPVHVYNFLALARSGAYDGRIFHRVVPDFVIQGGDYRGDGNGAKPWAGSSLRHEFGPHRFERGSLGMPRNEDFDSGGSQFFVTHRPTPHLDSRYTLFGELRNGGDVLDRIEVGDRILSVRILP